MRAASIEGFAESEATGLVADQWAKDVATFFEVGGERGGEGFLAFAEIDAADYFTGVVEGGDLVFEGAGEEHAPEGAQG